MTEARINPFCGMTFEEMCLNDSYEGEALTYSFSRHCLFSSFLIPIPLLLVFGYYSVVASS